MSERGHTEPDYEGTRLAEILGSPETRAACEHFYASHCYRGMSVRLCMTCHEPDWDDLAGQLASAARGSEIAAPEPLIMPADEFAALKAVAEAAGEQPWTPEEIAGFRERFAAAMANPGPLTVLNLAPSGHWKDRAEVAEAKLAAIAAHCRARMNGPGRSGISLSAATLILGIAEGSDEEEATGA